MLAANAQNVQTQFKRVLCEQPYRSRTRRASTARCLHCTFLLFFIRLTTSNSVAESVEERGVRILLDLSDEEIDDTPAVLLRGIFASLHGTYLASCLVHVLLI